MMTIVRLDKSFTTHKIRYGNDSEQFGDLYVPENKCIRHGLFPTIILVHGGYWKDNHDLNSYATSQLIPELVTQGWAVWNIEYRRMNSVGENVKAPWPNVFADIASAVDALQLFADEYSMDTQNVSVIGHSAGGCLALWAASRRQIPVTSPLYNPNPLKINRVISIGGVLSLTHPQDLCQPEQIIRLMGGSASDWPERYRACDPAQLHDSSVRTLVIHGEKDETVSVRQALYFEMTASNKIQLDIWSDADHFSMFPHEGKWHPQQWTYLKEKISKFLRHESDSD